MGTRRVASLPRIVSANYFKTLGVSLWQGRTFAPEEEVPGASLPVVIVSYQYWRQAGEDPGMIGKSLWINGRAHAIVGIAREGFTGRTMVASSGIWLPLGMYESTVNDFVDSKRPLADRDNHCLFLVGRLKPGLVSAGADSQLAVLAAQLEKAYPRENEHQTILTHGLSRFSLSTQPSDESELTGLSILLAAMAGLVLLIACFNLANMMLARGTARRKEFAIRLALGSGRRRILSQLLVEGFLLSVLGAALGFLFASWGLQLLIRSLNAISPIVVSLHFAPDARVFGAMLGFCLFSTILFSIGPALKAARPDLVPALKECAGENASSRRGQRIFAGRNLLVVGQLALSLALLAAAGLFVRGALNAGNIKPGYSFDQGILVELDAGLAGYDEAQGRAVYRHIQETLSALPGVDASSVAATVPFGMVSLGRSVLRAEDASGDRGVARSQSQAVGARFNSVGADYFRALDVGMLRGRAFTPAEEISSVGAPVAIVDASLAARLWPGADPLGKRIVFRDAANPKTFPELEVVGVVPTLLDSLLEEKQNPHVYVPFGQVYQSNIRFHVRAAASGRAGEAALMQEMRRAIRSVDGRLPVLSLKSMRAQLDDSMDLWLFRTGGQMFSVLGGLALFLAVVGVYGLKAYTVAQQTRAIGIRMAIGATVGDILRMFLGQGFRLTLLGAGIGLGLALLIGRLLSNLLYEVSPMDPVVFVGAPLLLAAASLLASYLPARRAAKVDPLIALRYE